MTAPVTLVVPTWQRPGFLNRLLTYYASVDCEFPILIADSSEPQIHRQNLQTVHGFSDSLDLSIHLLQLDVTEKCSAAVDLVQTPFAAFSADDDFQIPDGVSQCTEFLCRHDDFQVCSGRTVFAAAGRDTVAVRSYRSVLHNGVISRLNQTSLGQYYCLFYGVHRTADLRRRLQIAGAATNTETSRILPEAMLVQLLAMDGKSMQLPVTSYIMEGHAQNFSRIANDVQDPSLFASDFKRYLSALCDAAVEAGVAENNVERVMTQSFLDLVPGCAELVRGKRSGFRRISRKIRRALRRLAVMGTQPAGRKKWVRLDAAAAEGEEVRLGLELLQRPMDDWEVTSSRAA